MDDHEHLFDSSNGSEFNGFSDNESREGSVSENIIDNIDEDERSNDEVIPIEDGDESLRDKERKFGSKKRKYSSRLCPPTPPVY